MELCIYWKYSETDEKIKKTFYQLIPKPPVQINPNPWSPTLTTVNPWLTTTYPWMWGSINTTTLSEPPKSEYSETSYSTAPYSTDLRIPKITFATTTMPEPSKSEYSKALYSTASHSTDLKIPKITFTATSMSEPSKSEYSMVSIGYVLYRVGAKA